MSSAIAKERRARLKLPMIPQRVDAFLPKPLPLPLPLPFLSPSPSPSPSLMQSEFVQPYSSTSIGSSHQKVVCFAPAIAAAPHQAVPESATAISAEAIEPGDVTKLSLLGHGSGGKVYKVKHRVTGKLYALKIIQEKHEATVRRQILREMQILRRADSPYVVSCHGIADHGGEISFVLEFMDCGSLADLLEQKKTVPESFLSNIARQVLCGLCYLHQNKIVHRDIKPANLLINSKREVKIADFGVSKVLTSTMAPCDSFVGTSAYMSPERFDPDSYGGKYDGYAGDIWSLGLSLLECYIGYFPLVGPGQKLDWPTLMVAICFGDPPVPPPEASPEFRNFLKHCLLKDASRRPTAAQLLTHPFITMHTHQHNTVRPSRPANLEASIRSIKIRKDNGGKAYKVQHRVTRNLYMLKIIQDKHEPMVWRQILHKMQILLMPIPPT